MWDNLRNFYGISEDFKKEFLYYQKGTFNSIVFVSEGLHEMMGYDRKYKFHVINIGVKLFGKNRDDKSPGKVR